MAAARSSNRLYAIIILAALVSCAVAIPLNVPASSIGDAPVLRGTVGTSDTTMLDEIVDSTFSCLSSFTSSLLTALDNWAERGFEIDHGNCVNDGAGTVSLSSSISIDTGATEGSSEIIVSPTGDDVDRSSSITARFPERMVTESMSMTLNGNKGSIRWSEDYQTATLTPAAPLGFGKSYTVVVNGTTVSGINLMKAWHFRTAAAGGLIGRYVDEDGIGCSIMLVTLSNGMVTLTNEVGFFSFGNLARGEYNITFERPNFFVEGSIFSKEINVTISPGKITDAGTIVLKDWSALMTAISIGEKFIEGLIDMAIMAGIMWVVKLILTTAVTYVLVWYLTPLFIIFF